MRNSTKRKIFVALGVAWCAVVLIYYLKTDKLPDNGKTQRSGSRTPEHQANSPGMEKLVKVTTGIPKVLPDKNWRILEKPIMVYQGEVFPQNATLPMTVASEFVIPNRGVCYPFISLTYLVLVHSAPGHFERRMAMRNTWAKPSVLPNVTSRTVFLLGSTSYKTLQNRILKESEEFQDIVQGSFKDQYENLTLKAVMGLRWISENCRHVEFIIKVDDDVFVNIAKVQAEIFPLISMDTKQIVCSVEPAAIIFRVGDPWEKLRKWMVPHFYFKSLKHYPVPFCYGFATFYSSSLAVELFEAAKSTPFYRLDDVFVYGILASKVRGLTWRNATVGFHKTEDETQKAIKNITIEDHFFAGTANTQEGMQILWRSFT